MLNVGWLDRDDFPDFTTAEYSTNFDFVEALNLWCNSYKAKRNATKGWHNCPFCPTANYKHCDAEIHVLGNNVIYAAPGLIGHYIASHRYKPPQEFIDAVMRSDFGELATKLITDRTERGYDRNLPPSDYDRARCPECGTGVLLGCGSGYWNATRTQKGSEFRCKRGHKWLNVEETYNEPQPEDHIRKLGTLWIVENAEIQ